MVSFAKVLLAILLTCTQTAAVNHHPLVNDEGLTQHHRTEHKSVIPKRQQPTAPDHLKLGRSSQPRKTTNVEATPDVQTLTVSYMLMGAVTFVMALFYLVQSPDLDIRFYSWDILRLAASFFVAVLTSDVINSMVVDFTSMFVAVNPLFVDVSLGVFWFLGAQIATAILTGAFDEKVKEPDEADDETEREELQEFWDKREMSVECWGGLIAHCGGFAGLRAFTSIQDLPIFSSSPFMSLIIVPFLLVTVVLIYRAAALVRYWISLLDDGEVCRAEHLWNKVSEEAEDESICLCLSFAVARSASFFFIGVMPSPHFDFKTELENTMWAPFALWAIACLGMGVLAHSVKETFSHRATAAAINEEPALEAGSESVQRRRLSRAGSYEELVHEEGALSKRMMRICSEVLIMAYAWGMVTASTICMKTNFSHQSKLVGHVTVALAVSGIVCIVILVLDKIADTFVGSAGTENAMVMITNIIMSHGLLIGISWEVCFYLSMKAISKSAKSFGENMDFFIAVFLCIVVVPAYRFFMLPESKIRKARMLQA